MAVLPRHRLSSSRPLDATRTQQGAHPITFKKRVLSLRRLSYLVLTLLGLILVTRALGRWSQQPYDYNKLLLATPDNQDEVPFKGSLDEDLNADSAIWPLLFVTNRNLWIGFVLIFAGVPNQVLE